MNQVLRFLWDAINNMDLPCAIMRQGRADGAAGATRTDAEKAALRDIDAAFCAERSIKTGGIGIIADQLASWCPHDGITGADFFAEWVERIQIAQHRYFIGAGNGKTGKIHPPQPLDDLCQVLLIRFCIKIEQIQSGCRIGGVLHAGSKRLPERLADQRDHPCMDIDRHAMSSFLSCAGKRPVASRPALLPTPKPMTSSRYAFSIACRRGKDNPHDQMLPARDIFQFRLPRA